MWSNFHTHSHYCDGKGKILEYLTAASRSGVKQLGLSSHAPLPFVCKWCMETDAFPHYLQEIEDARLYYPEIEVYKGLEVDYIPGVISPGDYAPQLDYTIGSVHFVDKVAGSYWEIDNTHEIFHEGLNNIFGGDIRAAISRYYELTMEMVTNSPPNILGHMDKIKVNAADFFEESEPWYVDLVERTLKSIRETGIIVEVNTRGVYKKKSPSTYPSPWILARILSLGIPITINSDAHHPDDLTREFAATHHLLTKLGFKYLSTLENGIWNRMPLGSYGTDR